MNSQTAVTFAKTLDKVPGRIIQVVQNLSSGYSRIGIVCFSYLFDNSLNSHTLEARGCGHFSHLQRQPI